MLSAFANELSRNEFNRASLCIFVEKRIAMICLQIEGHNRDSQIIMVMKRRFVAFFKKWIKCILDG